MTSSQFGLYDAAAARFRSWALVPVVMLLSAGCGSGNGPSGRAINAVTAADDGLAAVKAKDWAKAEADLTAALDAKVLNGDQYEGALLGRVRARLETDKLGGAEQDLKALEAGAAAMDQVLALKAELQLKKGEVEAAKKTFEEAKKLNRSLTPPNGL